MTDQTPAPRTIPADKVQAVADWLLNEEMANGGLDEKIAPQLAARAQMCWEARAQLLALLRPTLADMSAVARAECQWMQCDVETWGRAIITTADWVDGHAALLDRGGKTFYEAHSNITPRPDLPRLEWPGDGVEDIPIVEEVIPGVVVGQPVTNPDVMLGISLYAPDGTVVVGRAPDCHPVASVKSDGPWQSVTGMRVHLYHALGVRGYAELESVTVVRWGKETNK